MFIFNYFYPDFIGSNRHVCPVSVSHLNGSVGNIALTVLATPGANTPPHEHILVDPRPDFSAILATLHALRMRL